MAPRDLLVRSPLFSESSPTELDKLAALLRRRRYCAGEPVFREGDPGIAPAVSSLARWAHCCRASPTIHV